MMHQVNENCLLMMFIEWISLKTRHSIFRDMSIQMNLCDTDTSESIQYDQFSRGTLFDIVHSK
jgi:hypothetical protein